MKKYIPLPPARRRESPIMTNPEKWNGQRQVLNVESVSHLDQSSLNQNHYARVLMSPLRVDRLSKVIQVPRDLLLTLSIKSKKKEKEEEEEGDDLWLLPNVTNEKSLSSNSYITSSYKIVSEVKKKWVQFVSLDIMTNNHTLTGIKDLQWSEKSSDIINTVFLEKLLELWDVSDCKAGKNDFVLTKKGEAGIQVIDGVTHVCFSGLKINNNENNGNLFEELLAKIDNEKCVISKDNTEFIDYLMKFLIYNDYEKYNV